MKEPKIGFRNVRNGARPVQVVSPAEFFGRGKAPAVETCSREELYAMLEQAVGVPAGTMAALAAEHEDKLRREREAREAWQRAHASATKTALIGLLARYGAKG